MNVGPAGKLVGLVVLLCALPVVIAVGMVAGAGYVAMEAGKALWAFLKEDGGDGLRR